MILPAISSRGNGSQKNLKLPYYTGLRLAQFSHKHKTVREMGDQTMDMNAGDGVLMAVSSRHSILVFSYQPCVVKHSHLLVIRWQGIKWSPLFVCSGR